MTTSQTIKKNLEEFESWIVSLKVRYRNYIECFDDNKNETYRGVEEAQNKLKSHLLASQLSTLESLREELGGMKKETVICDRLLTEGGGYPNPKAITYNQAISDIQSLITKIIKEAN